MNAFPLQLFKKITTKIAGGYQPSAGLPHSRLCSPLSLSIVEEVIKKPHLSFKKWDSKSPYDIPTLQH
jgi:hypothetical protein